MPYKNPEDKKECNKRYYSKNKDKITAYRNAHKQEKKEYDRVYHKSDTAKASRQKYAQSEKGKQTTRRLSKKYRGQNKKRDRAISAVNHAVRDNRLKREPCKVCGKLKVEGHHEDYDKPLDVIWLCRKHHVERHREIK